jgi:hypothetical protein
MAHRLAPRAETDLDEIWYYVAKESGSIRPSPATRLLGVETIPIETRRRPYELLAYIHR